jgi:hypothetical protein
LLPRLDLGHAPGQPGDREAGTFDRVAEGKSFIEDAKGRAART